MPKIVALTAALFAVAVIAGSAEAFDRPPISLYGLKPDGWGQTITAAETNLKGRYAGIVSTFCLGVTIRYYPASSSSWVHGFVRYWDKDICFGKTTNGAIFGLIYDQKSSNGWVIYRLKGASLADLRG